MPTPISNLSLQPFIDRHAYFNMLRSRPEHLLSYSLRSQAQLSPHDKKRKQYVNYDPVEEAAKIIIPSFDEDWAYSSLAAPIDASQTTILLSTWHNNFIKWRAIRLDQEVCSISSINAAAKTLTLSGRGNYGTKAASHGTGTPIYISTNSLLNQVRLPINLTSGSNYLITWDAKWDSSYLKCGTFEHKTFQWSTAADALMLELQVRFGAGTYAPGFNTTTDVGSVTLRGYGTQPIDPIPNPALFIIKPNKWTRMWLQLNASTGTPKISLWVADEDRIPVQIYNEVARDMYLPSAKFWLEYNTSTDTFVRGNIRDLTSYIKNFTILKNPSDIKSLLIRPI